MSTTVSIRLEDLTREQLEREVLRLQSKTDADLRQRLERAEEQCYRMGHELDDICSLLDYHKVDHSQGVAKAVRLLIVKLATQRAST